MDQNSLRQYFTAKHFTGMSEYEKKRHLNMKKNYEKMMEIGLDVAMPIFMKGPFHSKKRKVVESDDSDEEWKPGVDTVTIKKKKISSKFSAPFRTCGQTKVQTDNRIQNKMVSQQHTTAGCPSRLDEIGESGNDLSDRKLTEPKDEGMATNRYPKRYKIKPMICYKESEIPDDDNYIYCEDCGELNEGQCLLHPLTIVNDNLTSKLCKDRARQSLPDGLSIGPSKIRKAGLGVWTKKTFPKGVQFGPYVGEIVYGDEGYSGYAWQIHKDGKRSHFVDGKKENKSNWMRFVNCARNENEQNLVAFQHQGQIYYRSFKTILAHCELLVFYGQQYAQDLKIDGVSDGTLLRNAKMNVKGSIVECRKCNCCFMTSQLLDKHIKFVHQNWSSAKAEKFHIGDITSEERKVKNKNCKNKNLKNEKLKNEDNWESSCQKNVLKCKNRCSDNKASRINEGCSGLKQKDMFINGSSNLKTHLRIHMEKKPYECEQCGQKFIHNSALKTHLRIHTGEKPYECEQCGQKFTQSGNLKKHLRIHTGEKPYECEQCGQKFTQNSVLKTHLRIHTGEKPYECEQCGQKFTKSGNLKTHLRIHTGEKPYECEQCGQKFTKSGNLKTHLRIHTGEQPYECEQCGQKFTWSISLKKHLSICKNNKYIKNIDLVFSKEE